jgi:hypothetical protein
VAGIGILSSLDVGLQASILEIGVAAFVCINHSLQRRRKDLSIQAITSTVVHILSLLVK